MTNNTAQFAVDLGQYVLGRWASGGAPDGAPDWLDPVRRRLRDTAIVLGAFFCGVVAGALLFAAHRYAALLPPLAMLVALWVWSLAAALR
jgi:uncharacterized membrane protein YoaK (UPF0700 family)